VRYGDGTRKCELEKCPEGSWRAKESKCTKCEKCDSKCETCKESATNCDKCKKPNCLVKANDGSTTCVDP